MKKALLSWSGGKDCALALERVRQQGEFDIVSLLSTVTEDFARISMHGVRRSLLEVQSESLGIPLEIVHIPQSAKNDIYEKRMRESLERFRVDGVETVIFGDLCLIDIREYREKQMKRAGMQAKFPLWGEPSDKVAQQFLAAGYKAITVCVDSEALPKRFVGRQLSREFFSELPAACDPCGENGEFHTFVYDGPVFHFPIDVRRGDIVLRDARFYFCDLLG